MIKIEKAEGSYVAIGMYECTISLTDSVAGPYAPMGSAVNSPHVKGWGEYSRGCNE